MFDGGLFLWRCRQTRHGFFDLFYNNPTGFLRTYFYKAFFARRLALVV